MAQFFQLGLRGVTRTCVTTFLDIKIPDRSRCFHGRVCHTFQVSNRDLAHLEVHLRRGGGKLLEMLAESRQIWEDIAGMTLVADPADFKHLE